MVETVAADLGETNTTDSDATLAVERFKQAGVPIGDPAACPRMRSFPMWGPRQRSRTSHNFS